MAHPLTKRDKTGNLYVRPNQVEAQINEVLSEDPTKIRNRITVWDSEASDFLSSECLVHLAREFLRRDREEMANMVLRVLLERCNSILLSKIPDNKLPVAAYVREEALGQFGELFATDGTEENRDRLDYFECRFNRAFRSHYQDLVRSEKAHLRRHVRIPSETYDSKADTHKEIPYRLIEALKSQEATDSPVLLQEIHEAIDSLPHDVRQAVILCHVMGYKIESKNSDETTAATICNVSGRTVRNRLSRAAAKLSKFQEDL